MAEHDALAGTRPKPTTSKTKLESLTGLRFFAALVVFGLHSLHYGEPSWGTGLFSAGMAGVSFFYIVSGFVMAWAARPGDTQVAFYRRRFARIYPAYVVAWAVSLAVLISSGRGVGLVDLIPLTLLQSWVPNETVYFAANAVFWSLSCEAFFYLAFPFIFPRLTRLSTRQLLSLGLALVIFVLALATALSPFVDTTVGYWLLAIFPPVRLVEFIIGMILGLLLLRGCTIPVPLWAASALVLLAYVGANFAPTTYARVAITLIPFVLIIWSAAQADLQGKTSIFRTKPLVLLGTWSYCFYLIHAQAMTAFFEVVERAGINVSAMSGLPLIGAFMGAFACAVVASWLLHRFVEAPMEKRLRSPKGS